MLAGTGEGESTEQPRGERGGRWPGGLESMVLGGLEWEVGAWRMRGEGEWIVCGQAQVSGTDPGL